MSTAAKTEAKVIYDNATIPSLISLSPAPCRMIVIEVFHHDNKPAHHVRTKLTELLRSGLVRRDSVPTSGRSKELWFLIPPRT